VKYIHNLHNVAGTSIYPDILFTAIASSKTQLTYKSLLTHKS
jgi:hypothetical protein